MAFTTWEDLKNQMLDSLADGSWKYSQYSIGSRSMTYRSLGEFRKALEYVTSQAAVESGAVVGRTYGRGIGRA